MSTLVCNSDIARMRIEAERHRLKLDQPAPLVRPRAEILIQGELRDHRHRRLFALLCESFQPWFAPNGGPMKMITGDTVERIKAKMCPEFTPEEVDDWLAWWKGRPPYSVTFKQ